MNRSLRQAFESICNACLLALSPCLQGCGRSVAGPMGPVQSTRSSSSRRSTTAAAAQRSRLPCACGMRPWRRGPRIGPRQATAAAAILQQQEWQQQLSWAAAAAAGAASTPGPAAAGATDTGSGQGMWTELYALEAIFIRPGLLDSTHQRTRF